MEYGLWLVSTLSLPAVFIVYLLQYRVMTRQLDEARSASKIQNDLTLFGLLSSSRFQEASGSVDSKVKSQTPFIQWGRDVKRQAMLVVAVYDLIGGAAKAGIASVDRVTDGWGGMIQSDSDNLTAFLQSETNAGKPHDAARWLFEEVSKSHPA